MTGISSLAFWFHVHLFFGLPLITGVVLFIVWASRNVAKGDLKKLSLWLIAVGVVGALLTAPVASGFKMMLRSGDPASMRGMMRMMK